MQQRREPSLPPAAIASTIPTAMPRTTDPSHVTLKDVALRAEVSLITASRILNGSRTANPVASDTKQRVERAAADLGYRLNGLARAMRHRRSSLIGAVVANSRSNTSVNLPAYEYLLGLTQGLAERGYLLTIVRLADVDGQEPEQVRALDERLLDTLVVVGYLPPGAVARVRERTPSPIWLDTDVDAPTGCIRRDETAAGCDAARLLIAGGRRRVLWFQRSGNTDSHYSHPQRRTGAQAACREAGVRFETIEIGGNYECDPEALRRAFAGGDAGILASDPQMTRWLQWTLMSLGIRPAFDIGLATCDADQHLAKLCPGLSRIEVDRFAIGELAAEMAVAAVEGGTPPASRLVVSRVITGETA